MLSWETLDRPTSIKLKKIFSDPNLPENLDTKDFVDQLIASTMSLDDASLIEDLNKIGQQPESDEEASSSDESLQFTLKKDGENQDVVNDLEF